MAEIDIDKLPEIPRMWLDYAAGSNHPLLPEPFDLSRVNSRAERVRKGFLRPLDLPALAAQGMLLGSDDSVRRLQSAGSVAVITIIYPSLFGGPASQIWKCLMAIKACEELAKAGVTGVPVGCLSASPRSDIPPLSIELLDGGSELSLLSVPPAGRINVVDQIRKLGNDSYSEEVLQLLADASSAESRFGAEISLLSNVMRPKGMLFLDIPAVAAAYPEAVAQLQSRIRLELVHDREAGLAGAGYFGEPEPDSPESLLCSFVLPVLARVIDPHELFSFSGALPVFDDLGMIRPLAWPCSGVTLADARSRKILEKYNLEMFDLFSGEGPVAERLLNSREADSVLSKLEGLKSEVERTLSNIGARSRALERIEKDKKSCNEKIVYQIWNLRRRFESARRKREDAVIRQIHRACNLLAPNGRIQEREISGICFLLRYTQTVLQSVLDRLNAFSFQHQLITME